MKRICFLIITGLCMAVFSFGQEKAPKKPSPPPPPPEIVKDVKIENVKEVEPPPPPPPPPLPPKKRKHVHHKINTVVVQPKDPGKTTKPKKSATSI
jgi:hypothetical protein